MNFYPTILSDSLNEVESQLALIKSNPQIKTVQIDVIDGFFASNLTVTPMDLIDLDFGDLKIDFHLMTEEPLSFIEEIVNFKDHLPIRTILPQLEKMSSQEACLELCQQNGLNLGFSFDLFTPLEELLPSLIPQISALQLMAVEAGAQGQKFDNRVLDKIKEARRLFVPKNPNLEIIIDGGVKLETLSQLDEVGVDSVGVGSAIWTAEEPQQSLANFAQKSSQF